MSAMSRPLSSMLALGAALAWAGPATAQRSFQGEGQVIAGSATINQASGTLVQVATPQTVINWVPDGGSPGAFQPAGTTALFTTQAGSGLNDFAVLNRILPGDGRAIQLDGTILSRLQGASGPTGGTVYFYSPGGIVVGPTAVIDVGSLGLTTSEVMTSSGQWIGPDGTVRFKAGLPGASIALAAGAQVTTSGSASSYTAIVAPQIRHEGSIRTAGAAALVAADAATITFSPDNLFSIQVSTAAPRSAGGLTVAGGSIGRASAGPIAAAQRLYLVSIPKNTAMTMLIEGGTDLGFTPAGSARIDGNAIVLAAGRDVERGALGAASGGLLGNAVIQDATFRDATTVGINGAANLLALNGDLRFGGDLAIESGAIALTARGGHSLTVGGALRGDARRTGNPDNATAFGGTIDLVAGGGGSLGVGGDAVLLADGMAAAGGSGIGGAITLRAERGSRVQIGGGLQASADGVGGSDAFGGSGTGGSIRLATTGGALTIRGSSLVHADGSGGVGTNGAGGGARGGTVALDVDGGQLALGSLDARADARGGASAGNGGGDAAVGGLSVAVSQGGTLTGDTLNLVASARGGAGAGGVGTSTTLGGNEVRLTDGSATLGALTVVVDAAGAAPQAIRDLVSLDRASATVATRFGFTTAGTLGVVSNGGRLGAGEIVLRTAGFVAEPAPESLGALSAERWQIASGGDVIIGGTIASGSGLAIDVPGQVRLATVSSSAGDILIRAAGPLGLGDVAAGGGMLLASGTSLGAGRLTAADALALVSAGAIRTGALSAPGAGVVIGGAGTVPGGTPLRDLNWRAALNAAPATTGGGLLVDGTVEAGRLVAAIGGDARFAGAVSASNEVTVRTGGLLTIDAGITAPTLSLTSNDLTLGANASLQASRELTLISTNPAQLLIGDDVTGTGYALSNAEFGRLRGGNIVVLGRADTSAVPAIQIGRLSLAGSQLDRAGTLRIATVAPSGRAGAIAVAGALTGTGLTDAQTVELEAARIVIDGARGSINLAGGGALPAGQLNLRTDQLWAADPAILARLTADPTYAERARDLALPSATPHPEGIIRAGTVQLFDARQILIQNSGTRTVPAGITTSNGAFLSLTSSGTPIELIANGQIIGPNGITTGGFAVQTALTGTPGFRTLIFTPNSSINGCLVSALSCGPTTVFRDEDINLGSFAALPDKLFAEDDDDQGQAKKGKSSAITPAERLVDRKPVDRTQPVDEPVSGTGNPALTAVPTSAGAAQ